MIRPLLYLLVAATIFYIDISLPLGIAGGVPFVGLVLMGLSSPRRYDIFVLAAIGSILTVVAYPLSPVGNVEWMSVANRTLALFAIWVTAILCYRQRMAQDREHNAAREALQHSQQKFSLLIDSAPFIILLKDIDGRVLHVNRLFEEEYGVTAAEARGKRSDDLYPDSLSEIFLAQDRDVIAQNRVVTREIESVTADGTRKTKIIAKFPIPGPDGTITGIGAIGTDITERMEAERALQFSEQRFRGIFDNAGIGVWFTDATGVFVEMNRAVTEFLGYGEGELIGKSSIDITHPDDVASTRERVKKIIAGQVQRYSTEKRFLRKDGSTVWAISSVAPIHHADGSLRNIIVALQDITERKAAERALRESEERYRDLTEALPDGVLVSDRNGVIVFVNPAAVKLFRAQSADQLLGHDMIELVHPEDRADVLARRKRAGDQTAPHTAERRRLRLDGSEFISESRGVAVIWDGEPGILILIHDISEQRRTETLLRQAQKMEAIGQLTGGIAHDFNNLLTVIQGNAELLHDNDGRAQRYAQIILRASARGAELTQRLLAYSRQQPLSPHALDMPALVGNMSEMLDRTLGETVEITTRADAGLWTAQADPGQVENALLNLAINARDAMPDGGRLSIECANVCLDKKFIAQNPEASEGDYVAISVRDTGTGMTANVIAHAFDPFFTTKDVGQGSGMGLSMVYGFARQSGGYLTIDSAVGEGTTVTLYLPRGVADSGAAQAQDRPDSIPNGQGQSILIVEDDPEVRSLTTKMLEGLGYRVDAVPTALDGRKFLERGEQIDVILSDVVLPGGISGPEFVAQARTRWPEIKIVLMSGYPADLIEAESALGLETILLAKPFTILQLAQAIHDTLN